MQFFVPLPNVAMLRAPPFTVAELPCTRQSWSQVSPPSSRACGSGHRKPPQVNPRNMSMVLPKTSRVLPGMGAARIPKTLAWRLAAARTGEGGTALSKEHQSVLQVWSRGLVLSQPGLGGGSGLQWASPVTQGLHALSPAPLVYLHSNFL